MLQSRKGSSDESENRVPTIKEALSKQEVALWVWLGQERGLGVREWGERWGETGAPSFSQQKDSHEVMWRTCFYESQTVFPTDLYFYFRHVVYSFLIHRSGQQLLSIQAAVSCI